MKERRSILFLCAAMTAITTMAESLGLALSGGGAKGAYEVGVWQALHEAGLVGDVAAISGSSIGAVNAALFASRPAPDVAGKLWLANLGSAFLPNERIFEIASKKKFAEFLAARQREYAEIAGVPAENLPADAMQAIEKEAKSDFTRKGLLKSVAAALDAYRRTSAGEAADGLCDGDVLRTVLGSNLPLDWPRSAPCVYATVLSNGDWTLRRFRLNGAAPHDRTKMLLASTAIPVVFPPVEIDGKTYVDGGWERQGGDNVPIGPILDCHPDIKTIIVVYLDDERHEPRERVERVRRAAAAKDVAIVEIFPSEDIGGTIFGWEGVVDTSKDTARKLIELGRRDAMRILQKKGMKK